MERLQITLSDEATQKYMEIMTRLSKAHLEGDCEPSGVTLLVEVNPIFGTDISLVLGENILIGSAEVDIVK